MIDSLHIMRADLAVEAREKAIAKSNKRKGSKKKKPMVFKNEEMKKAFEAMSPECQALFT